MKNGIKINEAIIGKVTKPNDVYFTALLKKDGKTYIEYNTDIQRQIKNDNIPQSSNVAIIMSLQEAIFAYQNQINGKPKRLNINKVKYQTQLFQNC